MIQVVASGRSGVAAVNKGFGCQIFLLAGLLAVSTETALGFSDWAARRDMGVVRQRLDYSCGIAALATYVTHYWQQAVSERDLLELLVKHGDGWGLPDDWQARGVSWQILQQLATQLDMEAAALSLPPDLVLSLRVPALVRLVVRGQAHFSVLRGVDATGRVQLADPSWGNHILSREGFLDLWLQGEQRGTVMLLRPKGSQGVVADPNYFRVQALPVYLKPPA